MKKFYLIPAFALALTSCNSDLDNQMGQNENSNEKTDQNYISLNIVTATPNSRDAGNAANYEDGIGNENTVNVVRLYFFDQAGDPFVVNVNGTTNYSYVTASVQVTPDETDPNVEKVIATGALSIAQDNYPSQVIAVINPDTQLADMNMAALSDVQGAAVNINGVTNNFNTVDPATFVMSNSVYASNQTPAQKIEAVTVTDLDFYPEESAAQAHPVTIYVERVVGKVALTSALPVATGVTGTLYETGGTYNNQPVYVKFLGWNVTSVANSSYLMKNINPGWPDTLFGQNSNQPWNYPSFFRSFWAVNPAGVGYDYFNFGFAPNDEGSFVNANDPTAANGITGFTVPSTSEGSQDPVNYTYIQENAAQDYATGAGTNHPSQVIVAAQLCDAYGNPLTFAQWGSGQYTVEGLKNQFLTAISSSLHPYKKISQNGVTTYAAISAQDIDFATAMSLDPDLADWETKGRYYVYAQLTPEAAAAEWVNGDNDQATTIDTTTINNELELFGHVKIWNNGYTYYYFDIRHLGADNCPGYYGIVRNHIYKCNVTELTGLGTPVYDPTETIYPEKPLDEDTFIAAQINILSWRIVSQDVKFAW